MHKTLLVIFTASLWCCSCAVQAPLHPPLPDEASFNYGAGRGAPLLLTLHLADGEPLLFAVDTGCDETIVDKSLEPKLGKRAYTGFIWYGYFGIHSTKVYPAPALFLNQTQLLTGRNVHTDDLDALWPGGHLMGILGMDCLKHYCVQLDFQTNRIRFLDAENLKTNGLGRAYPLTDFFGELSAHADFFGAKNASIKLDSGDNYDCVLKPELFRRSLAQTGYTNRWKTAGGMAMRDAVFPAGQFDGETYTDLMVRECPVGVWLGHQNLMGLRFLARHLVTLDFPRMTMYLQRQSAGPLPNDLFVFWEAIGYVNGKPAKDGKSNFEAYVKRQPGGSLWLAAGDFLMALKKKGLLPGWSKDEQGSMSFGLESSFDFQREIQRTDFPATRIFVLEKNGADSKYHYTVMKNSQADRWQLQKAWRTDKTGRTVQEYSWP